MTDSDDLDFADGLAQMAKLKATAKRHEDAAAAVRKQAADLAPHVARAGFRQGIKRVRAKLLRESPFSATTLRQVLDEAGIPPDDRFDRSKRD